MKLARVFGTLGAIASGLPLALIPWALTGCSKNKDQAAVHQGKEDANKGKDNSEGPAHKKAEIRAALAKLSPEDRKLAEAQRFCVVQTEEPLGGMGTPIKLSIKGETVFICCKGCTRKAEGDPEKTLKTLEELKSKAKANSPLS